MDKNDNINTFNHSISLNERKNIIRYQYDDLYFR